MPFALGCFGNQVTSINGIASEIPVDFDSDGANQNFSLCLIQHTMTYTKISLEKKGKESYREATYILLPR